MSPTDERLIRLHKVVIEDFAKFLDKQEYVKTLIENFQSLRLIEILHREGINIRYFFFFWIF